MSPLNFSVRSDFMEQVIPETVIPPVDSFYVARYDDTQHMIFSRGSDGMLYLVLADTQDGKNRLINLSNKFGISNKIVAFSISQDKDLTLYLVAAEAGDVGKGSTVHIMKPSMPNTVDWNTQADLKHLVIRNSTQRDINIKRVFLGTSDDHQGYPLLVFSFSLLDQSLPPNSEVAWVKWGDDGESWDYHPNFSLPENAANMIDICPGSLNQLRGLFTLYTIQGQTVLRFVGFPGPYGVSPIYDLDAPSGARCLATLRNSKGLTDLVIGGGDGLYHITSAQARRHKNTPQVISGGTLNNDPNKLLVSVEQLHLSQTNEFTSVLFKNAKGDVSYQEFSTALAASIPPTPLLGQKSGGGTFSVLLNPITQCHQVFIAGNNCKLQMLEQSGEKRLWKPPISISYPSLTDVVKFTSYTTHVRVTGNTASSSINKRLRISSRSEVTLTINGIVKNVGPGGVLATTNAFGEVTIIARSDDMAPPTFYIAEETDDGVSSPTTIAVDPAETVKAKLHEIANSENPEEHQLFKASKATTQVIQQGVAALKGFSDALYSTSEKGPVGSGSEEDAISVPQASVVDFEWNCYETGGGVFQWLAQKLEEIGKVVVGVFKGVWTVSVEWGGKIWNFVLNTGVQILKAARWLLEDVLRIPIIAIIDALGFLFAWDDICDTQDLLTYSINTGIDLLGEGIDLVSEGVDDFFEDIRSTIKNLVVPDHLRNQSHSPDDLSKDEKTSTVLNSPGGSWSNYQIEHGGVTQDSSRVSDGIFGDDIIKSLDKTVQQVIERFKTKFDVVSSRFSELGDPMSKLSIGSILTLLAGDLADAFLEGTQLLVKGLLGLLKSMLVTVKKAINVHITIPLLSGLYQSMTDQNLTLLGAMSLLLAVPTTLLFKTIFHKKPRDIPGAQEILDKIRTGRRAKSNNVAKAVLNDDMVFATDTLVMHTTLFRSALTDKESSMSPPQTLVVAAHVSPNTRKLEFWKRWDKLIKKVQTNPVAFFKDIIKLGAISGTIFSVYLLSSTITVPDLARPEWNRKFYLSIIANLAIFIGTCPFLTPSRLPLMGLRGANWAIGFIKIPCCWLNKVAKAVIDLGVSFVQAIMEIIILVNGLCSDVKEFPDLPEGAMAVSQSISVIAAQVAKISAPIAIRLNGADGYSYFIAVGSAMLVPLANLVTYELECASNNQKNVHIVSILGLV